MQTASDAEHTLPARTRLEIRVSPPLVSYRLRFVFSALPRLVMLVVAAVAAVSCNKDVVATAPTPDTTTDTFSSQLGVGGSATRSFVVRTTGMVSVTLTSVGPPSTLAVGLGLGIPMASGNGCNLTRSAVTTAGSDPQVTATADSGTYCVRVYDVGNLTGDVTFSISILHP